MLRIVVLATLFLTGFALPAVAQQRLQVATPYPINHLSGRLADRWKTTLDAQMRDRVRTNVFCCGQLGNTASLLEAVSVGSVDVAIVSTRSLASVHRYLWAFEQPYVFDNAEAARLSFESSYSKLVTGQSPYELIGAVHGAMRVVAMNKRTSARRAFENRRIQPLQGSGLALILQKQNGNLMREQGPIAQLLGQGTIDGAEVSLDDMPAGASAVVLTRHAPVLYAALASKSFWNRLPQEDKNLLRSTFNRARDEIEAEENGRFANLVAGRHPGVQDVVDPVKEDEPKCEPDCPKSTITACSSERLMSIASECCPKSSAWGNALACRSN